MRPIDLATTLDGATSLGFLLTYTFACLLVSAFAIARSLEARRRARDAQDAIDGAGTLRDGGSVVAGFVSSDGQIPVSVRLREKGREWRTKKGWRHEWVERSRDIHAEPFVVVTHGGERVRVEPGVHTILVDLMGLGSQDGDVRERVAELRDGDEIAVTGTLRRAGAGRDGAYRSAAASWLVEPPSNGVMIISTEPLADRHRFWARAFLQIALVPIIVALAANAFAFTSYTQFVLFGETTIGHVDDLRVSTWRGEQGTHMRRFVTVALEGRSVQTDVDFATYARLHRGDAIAAVTVPGGVFLGAEPGLSWLVVIASCVLAAASCLVVTITIRRRSLWWEQRRVITSDTGRL